MWWMIRIHARRWRVVHVMTAIERIWRTSGCLIAERSSGHVWKLRHGSVAHGSVGSLVSHRRERLWKRECMCGEERGSQLWALSS